MSLKNHKWATRMDDFFTLVFYLWKYQTFRTWLHKESWFSLVITSQENIDILRVDLTWRPKGPSMHHHIYTFYSLPLALHCKFAEHVHDLVIDQNSVLLLCLMNDLVPPDEKVLVAFIHVTEVTNPHLFKLPLQMSQILLTILILTVLADLLEDIDWVEVLSPLFLLRFSKLMEDAHQNILDPIITVGLQKVLSFFQRIIDGLLADPFGIPERNSHQILTKLILLHHDLILTNN